MSAAGQRPRASDGIAVIGMSGRFPGAPSVERFWDNLRHGVESITLFTDEELRAAGGDETAFDNPAFVPAGSVLEDIDLFDAAFFGFSPREAESLDPQQRLFLETCWHALEDAAYDPARFPGTVGVYAGCAMSSYLNLLQSNSEFMALLGFLQVYIGNDKDYLATRVSYELDLKGPSFSIQTACSTSLLAVAVAGDHLLSGQCDMAIAGGACVRVPQAAGYYFEPGGIFSPDGHCRVFDEKAAGVVFGNGVGAVVLRRLADALADGDPIYAVVRGWAVNNDGSAKSSYAAPSLDGQADVISRAHEHAGVSADTISYVEAHGTGTSVGDPIEIAALTKAFQVATKRRSFCAVGSVKTNVGHLDPAAGVASVIKTVLALDRKELPPSLNCDTVNPAIDFADSPFFVNTTLSDWPANGAPRRAGISGFGIGGTNVHLVVEEAPPAAPTRHGRSHQLAVLSAKSENALGTAVDDLAAYLTLHPGFDAAEVAYTLQTGRREMERCAAVVFRDPEDLVAALAGVDGGRMLAGHAPRGETSIAFMFSGQGTQYVGMAAGLYAAEPAFRATLDRCAELVEPSLGVDLRRMIYADGDDRDAADAQLTQTAIAQPALFAIEYSLAQLWLTWGIRPDALIGHSIGEYVAACLADVVSLEDALALVAERGRLMQAAPSGSMLAVALPEQELEPLLDGDLDLAAVNEPSLGVVSGPTDRIERLQSRLERDGVACRRLHTSHAFHSRMMDGVVDAFAARLRDLALSPPRIPYISNLTGDWISDEQATSAEYWAQHLRRPVRFSDGISRLLADPHRALLEVGPGETLASATRRHPDREQTQLVTASLRAPREQVDDTTRLLETLGRLWLAGAPVDWDGVHAPARPNRLHLPVYPFDRRRYWAGADDAGNATSTVPKEPDVTDWFYAPAWEYALAPTREGPPPASWLVFANEDSLTAHAVNRLLRDGHEVTIVRRGERFSWAGGAAFTIDPRDGAQYEAVLARLAAEGRLPENVLHLWSVGKPEERRVSGRARFDHWQDRGYHSLLHIARALLAQRVTTSVHVVVASTGLQAVTGTERLSPAKATLLGACRAISQEYPHIACRSVDVELDADDSRSATRAAVQLIAEFGDQTLRPTVAYRNGQRWLQVFEPLPIEPEQTSVFPLRRRGVYLVTGGLGRIGLAVADELAHAVRARLVLVGRTPFPDRELWEEYEERADAGDVVAARIRRLLALEEAGADVLVVTADVADAEQMRAVVEETHERFGRLDGVVHGAGNVTSDGFFPVADADAEHSDRQFCTKVDGLVSLTAALEDEQLDFVVLLSSISSVLSGLGYVAYGAANAFMDAYAHEQARTSGTRWLSIDWDTWEFEDDAADGSTLSMHPDEGVDAFRRVLSAVSLPQVVVSTGYLPARIEQWIDLRSLRKGLELRDRESDRFDTRPDLATAHVEPRNELEASLAKVWEETLGVRPIGVLDNFFVDLGGHSLLATQLISRLRTRFEIEIPLRRFFDGPTIAELAEVIDLVREGELASIA